MLTLIFTLFSTVFDMSVHTDTSATKSLPSCRRKTESPVPRTAPDLPKDLQRHWPRQCRKHGLMAGSRKEHSVFYHGFTMLQCLDTLVKVSKCQGLEGNCDTHQIIIDIFGVKVFGMKRWEPKHCLSCNFSEGAFLRRCHDTNSQGFKRTCEDCLRFGLQSSRHKDGAQ